jgi:2,3-bisphosphoglycerate-independent phosphoglycerate mutase
LPSWPSKALIEGDVRKKIKAIEDFDRYVVGTILSKVESRKSKGDIGILVLPDHPTPIRHMTHTSDAVPFVIYSKGISGKDREHQGRSGVGGFSEKQSGE